MAQGQSGLMWHIDAWDALGGRAFASQRERNKELADYGDSHTPTVYIGPPGFQPEQIANIAIAIAACHSNKFVPRVPRLLNDGGPDELSFSSASAVAEFVRRAFIGGGRTRGDGAPTAEGGGPESPPEGEDGGAGLASFLQKWKDAALRCNDEVSPQPSHDLSGEIQQCFSPQHAHMPSVEHGAMQIIASVLGAFPHNPDETNIEKWHAAASTLESAISELGIWRVWHFHDRPMSQQANLYFLVQLKALRKINQQWSSYLPQPVAVARYLLRCPIYSGTAAADIIDHLKIFLHFPSSYELHWQDGIESFPLADRYAALFCWPLPPYVQIPDVQSVGQLLSAFVSSPGQFLNPRPGILSIITFAAAFLGSRVEDRSTSEWRERTAANWLARSVPKYVFPAKVEQFILNPELAQHPTSEILANEEDLAGVYDREVDSSRTHW